MTINFSEWKLLLPEIREKLKQFNHSLIHLKLLNCNFDLMTWYELLSELPLLETLELITIRLAMNTTIVLTNEDLVKFLNFKDCKMKINFDTGSDSLDSRNNKLNIVIESRVKGTFNINDFIDSMEKNKSTKSLNFIKCIINKAKMWDIEIFLNFNSNTHILPMDDKSLDYLEKLKDSSLYLLTVNNEMLKFPFIAFFDGLIYKNHTTKQKNKCCSRKFIDNLNKTFLHQNN